jgi:transcription elongation factor Elf1
MAAKAKTTPPKVIQAKVKCPHCEAIIDFEINSNVSSCTVSCGACETDFSAILKGDKKK